MGIDKVIKTSADGLFLKGNAEDLPLPSSSQDLVLNVESSHLYDNPQKFFIEVHRILKPNGYFCWADLRYQNQVRLFISCGHSSTSFQLLSFISKACLLFKILMATD